MITSPSLMENRADVTYLSSPSARLCHNSPSPIDAPSPAHARSKPQHLPLTPAHPPVRDTPAAPAAAAPSLAAHVQARRGLRWFGLRQPRPWLLQDWGRAPRLSNHPAGGQPAAFHSPTAFGRESARPGMSKGLGSGVLPSSGAVHVYRRRRRQKLAPSNLSLRALYTCGPCTTSTQGFGNSGTAMLTPPFLKCRGLRRPPCIIPPPLREPRALPRALPRPERHHMRSSDPLRSTFTHPPCFRSRN